MILTRHDLRSLVETSDRPCVSIYMPTLRTEPDPRQRSIRLKFVLGTTEKQLRTAGLRARDIAALLEPAERLVMDGLFWQHQSDGLALFLSPAGLRQYRLPLHFDELVTVGERFHIKPLFPLLAQERQFFILAVSQNRVRLLQGTRHSIAEVDLEGVPHSLAEALQFDEKEKQLQFHSSTGSAGARGRRTAVFHGHGVGVDDAKPDILRYFHRLDAGLGRVLAQERAPLVLAAVEYQMALYREVNTYAHLAAEGIKGNADERSAEELHRKAWAILEPRFAQAQSAAADQYRQLASRGTAQASEDLREIVPAALSGRVDKLFVAIGVQRWGSANADTGLVELHDVPQPGDEDLLDLATVHTFLNAGVVYAVNANEVPGQSNVAATFRY